MQEVLPGVFQWAAVHPRIGIEVSSHFVVDSGTAIDPLLPAEGIEWFEGLGLRRVVLSNRHHLRDAQPLAERFGCPIHCHEAGLHEFAQGPKVLGFAFGERLADDLVALEMDAICPEDTVLHIEIDGGALLFADSLIHYGEVSFVPDDLIGDDPEGVKCNIRRRCTALLGEEFEHLLFAHGKPIIDVGREALRAVAEG
jgi:glyoxylase-like metal-dependent hydrolase (beta-lactamase superfamily II)